ncbi:uncharacterized protein LOC107044003 [Diachasma alloeum]|uniref:uncharacterized protein LOC107044003 n=1 Tax=Diachasma alloeum TaxID=454923 RepID=UPI0007382DCF|nr:uncharacterized protein LOC107044003 [Diachasma alloeum]
MGNENQLCMDSILSYLMREHAEKKHQALVPTDWTTIQVKNIPQQTNGFDCGVFTCAYAEHLTRHAPFTFSGANMPGIRRRMMEEIVSSQLQFSLPTSFPVVSESNAERGPKLESTLAKDVWQLPTGKNKLVEVRTQKIRDVFLHQSARFHQGDLKYFPEERANTQCTAIAMFSIVALSFSAGNITRDLLDSILIGGDQYYVQCKLRNNVKESHLCPEELLPSFTACGHSVTELLHVQLAFGG